MGRDDPRINNASAESTPRIRCLEKRVEKQAILDRAIHSMHFQATKPIFPFCFHSQFHLPWMRTSNKSSPPPCRNSWFIIQSVVMNITHLVLRHNRGPLYKALCRPLIRPVPTDSLPTSSCSITTIPMCISHSQNHHIFNSWKL